jgi:hypothetical protein
MSVYMNQAPELENNLIGPAIMTIAAINAGENDPVKF